MKKLFKTMLFALVALMMASCADTPKDVVGKYLDAMKAKDAETVVEVSYFSKDNSEEAKKQYVALISDKLVKAIDEKGGIDSYKLSDEKIDGDKATVHAVINYGDGTQDESDVECVKVDDEWLVDGGK